MHIPDGFINGAISAGAGVAAAGGVGAVVRAAGRTLKDRLVPFAGLTAAFIFALQMLNFPVAAGTSGHLIGGSLAAVLLGPWLGALAVTIVVVVQALLFADGGVTALGLNIINMALLTVAVGWPIVRIGSRLLPRRPSVFLLTVMAASWASVVVSSIGFSIQYAIGGAGGIEPATVFRAMVGTHGLIGIGEALITATAVGAVLVSRPDLVAAAEGLKLSVTQGEIGLSRVTIGGFVGMALAMVVALIVFVAPLASNSPDGLERVAANTGFLGTATESPLGGPFADYEVEGIDNPALGTALAGLIGTGVTFATGMVFVGLSRRRSHR